MGARTFDFWFGANGCEYLGYKGQKKIDIYDCDNPFQVYETIKTPVAIESQEQFEQVLLETA